MIGTKLGHFEITSHLGSGGMGEVYQATDSKLGRNVAIKLLPETFNHDAERVARLEREARMLASLNHPHIAAIYGLEESRERKFLVMELVAGETLAERIARGPIPMAEALAIATQISEALEAAHEKGVIHRDLKPANVKITPDGNVKVLDFGLAKAFELQPSPGPSGRPLPGGEGFSNSPTLSMAASQQGAILGTAAYMSPEQAKGRQLDRRTDIFAFGCVLYEMLTGKPAFEGEDVQDILGAVLKSEPDWTSLPSDVPSGIVRLLRLCLRKDVRNRRQTATDVRIDIEQTLSEPPNVAIAPARGARLAWIVAAAAGLMAAALSIPAVRYLREAPRSQQVMRFTAELGEDARLAPTAFGPAAVLSPDGKVLAFVAAAKGGTTQLYVRHLDQPTAVPLTGTAGARDQFFSPDGQWIAFFADGKLKKTLVNGGAAVTLCDAADDRGGTWMDDGSIVFGLNSPSGLWRVPSAGGSPETLTKVGPGEIAHRWPQAVQGTPAVLFVTYLGGDYEGASIQALSLRTGEKKLVLRGGYQPHYVPSGHMVYIREGTLFAAPFNLDQLEMTAQPVPVLENAASSPITGGCQFAFSESGALVYFAGGSVNSKNSLVWVDRKGAAQAIPARAGAYANPRLSPDGRAAALNAIEGSRQDIWTYDVTRDTLTRLSFEGTNNSYPLWTPDGKHVIYRSLRSGQWNLFWKPADSSGVEERLTTSEYLQTALSVSPDGRTLVYTQLNPKTNYDLMAIPLEGERKPQTILGTPFDDRIAQFSPDGHWLAYISNESGRYEVYVQPFPGPGGKQQVSTEGGTEIVWAKNGELFYRTGGNREKMMAVEVETQPTLRIGKPHLLFEGTYLNNAANGAFSPNYAVTPDGQRFLMLKDSEQAQPGPTQINVVLNWFEELKQKVPLKP